MTFFADSFIQYIIIAALLSSILTGITGTILELNNMGVLTAGIAHVVLAGVGIAVYFKLDTFLSAVFVSIISSIIISYYYLYKPSALPMVSNLLWGVGISIGIIFISLSNGYQQNLHNFLFGNIALVSFKDIQHLLIMNILSIVFVLFYFRQILLISFSLNFAYLQKLPLMLLVFFITLLISFSVLSLIQTVGIALVLILIVIPVHIWKRFSFNLVAIMILSSLTSFISIILGIAISYYYYLPTGATISIIIMIFFIASLLKKSN